MTAVRKSCVWQKEHWETNTAVSSLFFRRNNGARTFPEQQEDLHASCETTSPILHFPAVTHKDQGNRQFTVSRISPNTSWMGLESPGIFGTEVNHQLCDVSSETPPRDHTRAANLARLPWTSNYPQPVEEKAAHPSEETAHSIFPSTDSPQAVGPQATNNSQTK